MSRYEDDFKGLCSYIAIKIKDTKEELHNTPYYYNQDEIRTGHQYRFIQGQLCALEDIENFINTILDYMI